MYVYGPIFDYFSLFRKFDQKFRFCPKFPKFSKFSVRFEQGFRPFSLACFAKIFGLFLDFRNSPNFGISYRNENVPEFPYRNFRFRTPIFAKIHRTPKLLTERIALVGSFPADAKLLKLTETYFKSQVMFMGYLNSLGLLFPGIYT